MKVLHINDCAGVAENLVQGLRKEGVEADLFLPTVGTYKASALRRVALPFTRTIEAFRLRRRVLEQKVDFLHIHYTRFAYMALVTGLPYVVHCHGSDLRLDLTHPAFRYLTLLALKKAVKVFYSTPDLKRYLTGIRDDAIFLPNPIQIENFSPLPEPNQTPARVLSISKLDEFKGVTTIIRAIELIWQTHPKTEIAVFNFGSSNDEAKVFLEMYRNHPGLKQLGPVLHTEMPDLINQYAVILGQQNSTIGMFGVSELEAMACAKPVICNFQYPDAYPELPPVFVSLSPKEASEHILKLLDDAVLRKDVGEQARHWVIKYHDSQQVVQVLLEHYKALAIL